MFGLRAAMAVPWHSGGGSGERPRGAQGEGMFAQARRVGDFERVMKLKIYIHENNH